MNTPSNAARRRFIAVNNYTAQRDLIALREKMRLADLLLAGTTRQVATLPKGAAA